MGEKNISLKNYIILTFILFFSIFISVYFYMWYDVYQMNKLSIPIMDKYFSVINYNELENYLVENKDTVVYVSVLENNTIRIFEREFLDSINDYSLKNSILYMDLTHELKNDSIVNHLNKKYNLYNVPSIIIFEDGNVEDIYDISSNFYDVNNLISFLKKEEVIND